jgi:dipeptidyl aminopeptidase/acylaminoacyl peptidase
LWENPLLYLKGSAVLNADKVKIPMLIMHNEKDNQVQWHQGLEFYMALRRLKKRVWLLQYDNQEHSLYGEDAKDYTIRMTQFFDHYLKGASAPVWMTKGVPAKETQFKTGYELDPGVEP